MNLKFKNRQEIKKKYEVIGNYVAEYRLVYFIAIGLIAFFELCMLIRGALRFSFARTSHYLYMASYIVLLTASLLVILLLFITRKKNKPLLLCNMLHAYTFVILAWACLVSCLDMKAGNTPIVYLTVIISIAGIVVIAPIFYVPLLVISYIVMIIIANAMKYDYFLLGTGIYINVTIFVIMAIFICIRHYSTALKEIKARRVLEKKSTTDILTGLGNETAYFSYVDYLDKVLETGSKEFALCIMDVNNVKATNDTHGHRFGCNLIVTAGKTLPKVFPHSHLYHIGGDEFIAIIEGADLKNLDERLKLYNELLVNKKVMYEDIETTLDLAYGIEIAKPGMMYKDLFQVADKKMYKNKKELKSVSKEKTE